jgi:hypothetical protein
MSKFDFRPLSLSSFAILGGKVAGLSQIGKRAAHRNLSID